MSLSQFTADLSSLSGSLHAHSHTDDIFAFPSITSATYVPSCQSFLERFNGTDFSQLNPYFSSDSLQSVSEATSAERSLYTSGSSAQDVTSRWRSNASPSPPESLVSDYSLTDEPFFYGSLGWVPYVNSQLTESTIDNGDYPDPTSRREPASASSMNSYSRDGISASYDPNAVTFDDILPSSDTSHKRSTASSSYISTVKSAFNKGLRYIKSGLSGFHKRAFASGRDSDDSSESVDRFDQSESNDLWCESDELYDTSTVAPAWHASQRPPVGRQRGH